MWEISDGPVAAVNTAVFLSLFVNIYSHTIHSWLEGLSKKGMQSNWDTDLTCESQAVGCVLRNICKETVVSMMRSI